MHVLCPMCVQVKSKQRLEIYSRPGFICPLSSPANLHAAKKYVNTFMTNVVAYAYVWYDSNVAKLI
jgi:hypothetical protein